MEKAIPVRKAHPSLAASFAILAALACLGAWFLALGSAHYSPAAAAAPLPPASRAPADITDTFSMRRDHTLTPVDSSIYMFGGSTGSAPSSELWRFDPVAQKWHRVTASSEGPSGRQSHAAAAYQGQLYVLGGQDGFGVKKDDVWRYDPASGKWYEAPQETRPPARAGHTAGAANNQILIYGGTMQNPVLPSSVWVFDPASGYWTTRGNENPVGTRAGQSSGMLGTNWLFVGGEGTDDDTFLQAVKPDTQEYQSVEITYTGRPKPRKNQATAFDTQNQALYIFGGQDLATGRTITDTWKFTLHKKAAGSAGPDSYDPPSGWWERMADLPFAISGAQAAVFTTTEAAPARGAFQALAPGLRVLIAGGQDAQGRLVPSTYVFDGEAYQPVDTTFRLYLPLTRR